MSSESTRTGLPSEGRQRTLVVQRDVLAKASADAQTFRESLQHRGTLVVNLVSSPGSGKTTLLQAIARHWNQRRSMAVLVGDLETDRDAARLSPLVPTVQLTTGGACHLELPLVERGLQSLPDHAYDFLFIENVGNLVCPASHDLGEHLRMVLISVTEGDDKPGKYPKMFRNSDVLVVTKTDLLPYVPFDVQAAAEDARKIQPELSWLTVDALHDVGVEALCELLDDVRTQRVGQQA